MPPAPLAASPIRSSPSPGRRTRLLLAGPHCRGESRAGIGHCCGSPAPASAGDVLVRREDIDAAAKTPASRNRPEPGVAWLTTDAASPGHVLDTTAMPNIAYRYRPAQRRVKVQVAGRELEIRSDESAPVEFTLREIYAPSAPSGLTAVGFSTEASLFAVDLIWQPVYEVAVTAYNVFSRQAIGCQRRAAQPAHSHQLRENPRFPPSTTKPPAPVAKRTTAMKLQPSMATATRARPHPRCSNPRRIRCYFRLPRSL